jgi:hypothetical protein
MKREMTPPGRESEGCRSANLRRAAATAGLSLILATIITAPWPTRAAAASNHEFSDPRLVSQYSFYSGCPETGVDQNGVFVVDYETLNINGVMIGRQYNPTTISQFAIVCYYDYLRTGNKKFQKLYLSQIAWLKNNFVPVGGDMAAYEYHFPWHYGLQPGWRSGLAQGQSISALIRYYYDTGDASVLTLIKMLKKYMMLPINQGGLVTKSPEGLLWIEEYPSLQPSFVLNGFISATFGLYEYTRLFADDEEATSQLRQAIESIRAALPHYDAGDWTYLDRHTQPYPRATDSYAAAYSIQMNTLAEITGDRLFLATGLSLAQFL